MTRPSSTGQGVHVSEEYPYAAKAKITTLVESLELLVKWTSP
jgi:hypothetical protein